MQKEYSHKKREQSEDCSQFPAELESRTLDALAHCLGNLAESIPHLALSTDSHPSAIENDETPGIVSGKMMIVQFTEDPSVSLESLRLAIVNNCASLSNLARTASNELDFENIEIISSQDLLQKVGIILSHDVTAFPIGTTFPNITTETTETDKSNSQFRIAYPYLYYK